ncbi:eCIS core domain-containing protein [Sorangium sp. So ce861]|uniref:eCIS core domain-containing protein n=1 Tax=Sorangium sp. So ce861 TaxID=3133323 RepID=UPI003F6367D4
MAQGGAGHDARMRALVAERALRTTPVQAKPAAASLYTAGIDELIHAARSAAPNRPETTGMPSPVRAKMEAAFGADFSDVRVHPSSPRAAELGALAYTQGSEIHVAPGYWAPETRRGQELLGHELTHVVQQRKGRVSATVQHDGVGINDDPALEAEADALGARAAGGETSRSTATLLDKAPRGRGGSAAVQLRSATWIERRAWLAFFDHYLPRMFLNNYMDDTGAPITLNQQQMQDCNPVVDIRRSQAFMAQVARLQAAGGGAEPVRANGWGGAMTNGTLGNFTIHWVGSVVVHPDGTWTFIGTVDFYDYWDFDPKGGGSNRPVAAEVKVRVADMFLPGQPFHIHSAHVFASQSSGDSRASWPSSVRNVPDRAARTGADIAVGDVGGGEVGGEVGAQAAEDLNP